MAIFWKNFTEKNARQKPGLFNEGNFENNRQMLKLFSVSLKKQYTDMSVYKSGTLLICQVFSEKIPVA